MASSCTFKYTLIFLVGYLFLQPVLAEPQFLRKVSVSEVEADVQATLSDLLRGNSAGAQRRAAIEASTWQSFQALPKTAAGRLAPPAVRYLVHGYFARTHGWLIKGLEPHGNQLNITEIHDVSVLQDKAPLLVEGLLEARQSDKGLSFEDVVTMVSVLEQMMFDESVTLLQAAYRLNGLTETEDISETTLHVVLQSYLVLFAQGANADLYDVEHHQLRRGKKVTANLMEFEQDTVLNYEFARRHRANRFRPQQYSFQAVAEIMADLAQKYGRWQNSECRVMKSHLAELDPEGLGAVPLGLFYAQPQSTGYHFSESADYLRRVGALDETAPSNPKVYIANYVMGPSNCIASSSYYSVCCLSECSEIQSELEQHIGAPTAIPERLLAVVRSVLHVNLPRGLPEKLDAIAARHAGEVPLHGRLFAQWLHFAFPHECPFPSLLQSSDSLAVSQWINGQSTASVEERDYHVTSKSASAAPSAEDADVHGRWSDVEVLPVHERPRESMFYGAMRTVMQLVAIVVALRSALAAWRGVAARDSKAKKDDDFELPFRV